MTTVPALLDAQAALRFSGQRVLLTGASGFIGGHVARQALAGGVELHVLGRKELDLTNPLTRSPRAQSRSDVRGGPSTALGANGKDDVVLIHHQADLADGAAVERAVRRIAPDLIVHLASPGVAFGTADFATILDTLVTGGAALLRGAAALARVPHFVQAGTGFEYASRDRPITEDDPIVPSATAYGAAKAAASALLGGFRGMVPITLVRPFNVYGAGDTAPRLGNAIVDKALADAPIAVSAGEQLRDFLHVDDFGRLLWSLAEIAPDKSHFAVFNAGSGKPVTLRAYIAELVAALESCGLAARVDHGAIPYRPGEPMIAVPDLSRLHAASAWRPRIAFSAGVTDFVRWRLQR